jgi:peptide deformylase
MAVLTIHTYPDPVLKVRCAEVTAFDAALHQFLDDMADTMAEAEGIGLAANQVGQTVRLFLMDVPLEGEQRTGRLEIINPRVLQRRGETKYEEGCLSFPGLYETVMRASEIDLAYQDRHGAEQRLTLRGLPAICCQHELDHLDGVTFVDRLSPLKRRIALRDYERAHRETIEDKQFRAKRRSTTAVSR